MRLCQILFLLVFAPSAAFAALESDFATWEAQQRAAQPSVMAVANLARRHADWPGIASLVSKIEAAGTYNGLPAEDMIALFTQRRPRQSGSIAAYINALGANTPRAKAELETIWREEPLDSATQDAVLSRFSNLLSRDAHIVRIDMLLDRDRLTQASSLSMKLDNDLQAWTLLRVAVLKGEVKSPNSLPSQYRRDAQIIADFAKLAAQKDNVSEGSAYFNELGVLPPQMASGLWSARHRLAREALEGGQIQTAYKLAAHSGLQEGSDFAAAEFLAGFIALKPMNNPSTALNHFMRMHQSVTGAVSKSRAAYWAGRASEAVGDAQQAQRWYGEAARYPTTYFGQQAFQKLGRTLTASAINSAASDAGGIQSTDSRLAGARYFYRKGEGDYARQFLLAAIKDARGSGDYKTVSDIALQNKDRTAQVKLAREAGKAGFVPNVNAFPKMSVVETQEARAGGMRNMALVHAIIRQESEFDAYAQSHAGARGLMQLMPATAKHVAGRNDLRHDVAWLTSRPDHNVRLGSSYLASLLERYNGSEVLAIAAYNAGPGRVSQWIERFGDPRTDAIKTEDWIELIPIYETRNYIQRVQEGEAVYASIL